MMNFKPIPIGVENFKDIIDKGYYYVDKTLFIKDILDSKSYVNLYTRPRRFGKTLNMSMLKYYFEKTDEDNSYLFEELNISKRDEKYKEYQGQYTVISVSFKSMKQPTFEEAFIVFKELIKFEFLRHKEAIFNSNKTDSTNQDKALRFIEMKADKTEYNTSLSFLSKILADVYNKKVIILIDEYDVPLESAYFRGYYDEMVNLIRSVFESALKTNEALEFGVLTGCLRISKESIFTGLNNLDVYSIINNNCSSYFGFTEQEVVEMTEYFGINQNNDALKDWYDGYQFGETEIYNPWSILKYAKAVLNNDAMPLLAYWSNTSSNDIIHKLITEGSTDNRGIVENLINGGTISKPLYEDITYRNIDVNSDFIWSFLLHTGYLKAVKTYLVGNTVYADLVIPNREIVSIYENTIMQWFNEKLVASSREDLFNAVISGDTEKFEDILLDWLEDTISYYDTKENYYHGFLSGLLSGFKGYRAESNRENGIGRTDITLLEQRRHKLAVIIEIKVADEFPQLEQKCDEALQQIEDKQYDMPLKKDCYQKIVKYGVAFNKKSCMIKMVQE
ncbi:MAG: AAA family ATPase [Oscillospiraceae bacterium]|nr:AAA family ATPase [Oscillospiraceae bacterium]